MAHHRMSETEVHEFLDADPPHTAKLATVRADGRPHVAPVWFARDGDSVVFSTGRDSVKGKNLQRDPRLALSIDVEEPPYSYVLIEGTASLSEDPDQLRRWAGTIGGRYLGADKADELAERNGGPGSMVVRVPLDRVNAVADLAG